MPPINTTFVADFSRFEEQIRSAATALRQDFEVPVKNVQSSLLGMAKEFSGARVIQEAEKMAVAVTAVGGAAALTDREQAKVNATVAEAIQKYERLGKEVPADLRKLEEATRQVDDQSKGWSVTAGAVASAVGNLAANAVTKLVDVSIQAVGAIFTLGSELTDMAAKTGVSAEGLQQLKYAGEQSGVGFDLLTKSVTKMSVNLAGGNESAAAAAEKLGLSMADLRQQTPHEAFLTLTDAVRGVADPMAQAKIAQDLFGKSGADLLPAINSVDGSIRELGQTASDLGLVLSDETVGAVDSLGDQWDTLKGQGQTLLAEVLTPFLPLVSGLAEGFILLAQVAMPYVRTGLGYLVEGFLYVRLGLSEFLAEVANAVTKIPFIGDKMGLAADAVDFFRGQAASAREALAGVNTTTDEAAPKIATLKTGFLDLASESSTAAKAADTFRDAVGRLAGDDIIEKGARLVETFAATGRSLNELPRGKVDEIRTSLGAMIELMERRGEIVPAQVLALASAAELASVQTAGLWSWISKLPAVGSEIIPEPTIPTSEEVAAQYRVAMSGIPGVVHGVFAAVPSALDEHTRAGLALAHAAILEQGPSLGEAFASGFGSARDFGREVGATLLDAVTGGGDARAAVETLVGTKIGAGLTNALDGVFKPGGSLAGVVGSGFAGVLGGAVSAILPGVGALVGQGIGAIFDTVFKGEERKVNDLRDGIVAQAGGIHALNEAIVAAGGSLDRFLDTKKEKDLQAEWAKLEALTKAHQAALETWGSTLVATVSSGTLLTRDLVEETVKLANQDPKGTTSALYASLQAGLSTIASGFAAATAGAGASEASFGRLASAAVGVFEQLQAGGLTAAEAFTALQPALEHLGSAAETLKISVGGGLGELLGLSALADEFEPSLNVIGGLTQTMTGLANTGLLTSSLFADFAGEVGATFTAMASGGADAQGAMTLIRGDIQRMWELQRDFGYEVDATTQNLIDEAVQAGLVGDQFRDAQDRMVAAVNNLVSRLTTVLETMGVLPRSAADAAAGVSDGLGSVETAGFTATINGARDLVGSHLPASAATGIGAVNSEMGRVSTQVVQDRLQDARYWMYWGLPDGAQQGIVGVNRELERIDVSGVQDATHDISWEFERGIPDAAQSGADLVNRKMDTAELAVEDVRDVAKAVAYAVGVEVPGGASAAERQIDALSRSAVEDFGAMEDALNGILYGHSPGGLKEFAPMSSAALSAIRGLASVARAEYGGMEAAVDGVTSGLGRLATRSARGLSLAGGGEAARPIQVSVYLDSEPILRKTITGISEMLDVYGVAS